MKPAEANAAILAALDIPTEYRALGVEFAATEPNSNGFLACRAIDREDRNPSAAINLRTGYYVDLGPGGKSLSLWDFAVQYGGRAGLSLPDWKEARKHYAQKASVDLGSTGRPTTNPNEQIVPEPWNEALAALWCARKPPITTEAVRAAGGLLARYPAKSQAHSVVALPVFGPHLIASEPVGWVVWHLGGRPLPVWGKDGKVLRTVKMKSVAGSRSGLMGRHSLALLAADPTPRLVWKVEGPSDMMALCSVMTPDERARDAVICNSQGATEDVAPWIVDLLAGHRVNVLHDADQAGEIGAAKWLEALAPVCEVRQVKLPYEVTDAHGKDLRDWVTEEENYGCDTNIL